MPVTSPDLQGRRLLDRQAIVKLEVLADTQRAAGTADRRFCRVARMLEGRLLRVDSIRFRDGEQMFFTTDVDLAL